MNVYTLYSTTESIIVLTHRKVGSSQQLLKVVHANEDGNGQSNGRPQGVPATYPLWERYALVTLQVPMASFAHYLVQEEKSQRQVQLPRALNSKNIGKPYYVPDSTKFYLNRVFNINVWLEKSPAWVSKYMQTQDPCMDKPFAKGDSLIM